jgi:hypothetical protein
MNSQLYHKKEKYYLHEFLLNHLKKTVAKYPNDSTGVLSLNNFINNGWLDYSDLKNMKANFEKGEFYEQYGGDLMRNWVFLKLETEREKVAHTNKIQSGFKPNQYIRPHEKQQLKPRLVLTSEQCGFLKERK